MGELLGVLATTVGVSALRWGTRGPVSALYYVILILINTCFSGVATIAGSQSGGCRYAVSPRGPSSKYSPQMRVVVTCVIRAELCESLAVEVAGLGQRSIICHADAGSPEELEGVFGSIQSTFGRLDIAVANAAHSSKRCPRHALHCDRGAACVSFLIFVAFLVLSRVYFVCFISRIMQR